MELCRTQGCTVWPGRRPALWSSQLNLPVPSVSHISNLLMWIVICLASARTDAFAADSNRSTNPANAPGCLHHGRPAHGHLTGDISIADNGHGYHHIPNNDPPDSDDWACPDWLISKIQQVGKLWDRKPRVAVLDLSRQGGGPFKPHRSHQNGRDVDIRYVGWAEEGPYEGPIDLSGWTGKYYDRNRTQSLVDIFCTTGASLILVYDGRLTGSDSCRVQFDGTGAHRNHFHVRYPDPDGTDN